MKQETITYLDGHQSLIGQLFFHEQTSQKLPGIIVFPAFEGISQFAIDYVKKLAEEGYITFVADIYGDGKTSHTIDGCKALIAPFLKDRALVRRRAGLAFDFLSKHEHVNSQYIGAMGFCFGGMCALEVARSGADLKALVSAHGVLQKSELPSEKIKSSILILHGYKDLQVPPQMFVPFSEEMDQANVENWRFMFFSNGKHSFTDPKTGTFDPVQEQKMGREYNKVIADATYRYATDFFEEMLQCHM